MIWSNLLVGLCPLCRQGTLAEGKYGFECSKSGRIGHLRCDFFITKERHALLRRRLSQEIHRLG